MQIYYKQSVNMRNNGWSAPMKTADNAWRGPGSACRWCKLKASSKLIIRKFPFAINTIERWHKRAGHNVVRQDRVNGRYRTTYLMVTKP